MRLIDADTLPFNVDWRPYRMKYVPYGSIEDAPTIDAVPVVRCKDCKHRPKVAENSDFLKFPDGVCPCQGLDIYWDSWMPKDNWFCANGERREMKDREMSREEAIKRLEEGAPFSELYSQDWENALAMAIKALKDEPVRCKDCKKRCPNGWCYTVNREPREDDFCSWGVKKCGSP